MKIFFGKSHALFKRTLGKITRRPCLFFQRHRMIFIAETGVRIPGGYAVVLTAEDRDMTKRQVVVSAETLSELHDGDVVLVQPDGIIHVLYDSQSQNHTLLVTERCNHTCVMCPQPPVLKEENKTEINLRLISLFDRKPGHIGVTGGEPTLMGPDLFVLLRAIRRRLPMMSVSVLTNGVRLSDWAFARQFADIGHPDLQVEIPLYADTDTEHNHIVGAGTFYQTIQGLHNLARLRLRTGLRIVIHRQTVSRLPQLAEFIYRNFPFVWHVMFMHMEPVGWAADHIQELWVDPYDCNSDLQKAVLYLSRRGMNVSIYNAQLCVLPEMLRPFARQSISEWKNMYLPECSVCQKKTDCPGLFDSAIQYHSAHIAPF